MRERFLSLPVLDRKLLRDLWHLRGQATAIGMVIASGVATLILALGAYVSLEETRRSYYERHSFAEVFATARRAPAWIADEIAEIPGVAKSETRIVNAALLDIEGMLEPASGNIISLPDLGEQRINKLYLREGRLPEPLSEEEVVVNESFATAHGFHPGDPLTAVINGRKRSLLIVGVALAPDFIYVLGPGDIVPDNRRTGVLWMSYKAVASALDLEGAFNTVNLTLLSNAIEQDVLERLNRLLKAYGGQNAYTRKDHVSHAFIDAELQQLRSMAFIIPPIFLAVAAFLLNTTLARLIQLEREQIGLLKALGYTSRAIGVYYLKFVCLITLGGILLGFALGTWFGRGLTELYTEFYHFPFLIFIMPAKYYLLAAIISFAAAILGAFQAVRKVITLAPAVAMQPPAPVHYTAGWLTQNRIVRRLPESSMMVIRYFTRYPSRAIMTGAGISSAVALLILSFFGLDSISFVIDVTFTQLNRQHISLSFNNVESRSALYNIRQLPGVMRAESSRSVPVTFKNGMYEKSMGLTGLPPGTELTKLRDPDLTEIAVPDIGIAISEKLAEMLHVGVGRTVTVEFKSGRREEVQLPVTAIVQGYLGLSAYMDLDRLNAIMRDGHVISGADLAIDNKSLPALYTAIKNTPAIASLALLRNASKSFEETIAENISTMTTIYIVLSATIAFGVIYNSARIQLSERGRELASLRILGFTRRKVMAILYGETIILLFIAIPIGWLAGYGLAALLVNQMETELYRVPLVVARETYAKAALTAIVSALASAVIIRRRIDKMDLVAVLKTRE